jgi:hypothetical protein
MVYAEGAQVNSSVKCDLLLVKEENGKPVAPVYWEVITKTFYPPGQTPSK